MIFHTALQVPIVQSFGWFCAKTIDFKTPSKSRGRHNGIPNRPNGATNVENNSGAAPKTRSRNGALPKTPPKRFKISFFIILGTLRQSCDPLPKASSFPNPITNSRCWMVHFPRIRFCEFHTSQTRTMFICLIASV